MYRPLHPLTCERFPIDAYRTPTDKYGSILVLKDGQIVEQGNHTELLAQNGVFASMWADQVSSSDPISRKSSFVKEEPSAVDNVSGQAMDAAEQALESQDLGVDQASLHPEEQASRSKAASFKEAAKEASIKGEGSSAKVDSPVVAFPSSDPVDEEPAETHSSTMNGGVSFPAATPVAAAPIAFPASDSASVIQREPSVASPTPDAASSPPAVPTGVTFEDSTSPRNGTPDPETEPKRKRTASQNFQRLARRISINTRREGSFASIIPGLRRDKSDAGSTPRVSADEGSRGEGSSVTAVMTDSPAPSVKEEDKKLRKKDKKRKSTLG